MRSAFALDLWGWACDQLSPEKAVRDKIAGI